MDNMVQY